MADTTQQARAAVKAPTPVTKPKAPAPVAFKQTPVETAPDVETADTTPEWQSAEVRPLQLKSQGPAPVAQEDAGAIGQKGVAGAGSELPFKAEMEKGFGTDLSSVRAHTDGAAAKASQSLGARAYATGDDIAFTSSAPDKATVAHEVAHVVQQRQGQVATQGKDSAINADPGLEREADVAAEKVVKGETVQGGDLTPTFKASPQLAPIQLLGSTDKTEKAREAHLAELDKTASEQATTLKPFYTPNMKGKGDQGTFEKIADAILGFSSQLDSLAAEVLGPGKVKADLQAATVAIFPTSTKGKWQSRYLNEIFASGEPQIITRMALSMGLLSHASANSRWIPGKPGDANEVLRFVEGEKVARSQITSDPDGNDIMVAIGNLGDHKTRILAAMARFAGEDVADASETAAKEAEEKANAASLDPAKAQSEKDAAKKASDDARLKATSDKQAAWKASEEHMLQVMLTHKKTFTRAGHAEKEKLLAELKTWMEGADRDTRAYVFRPDSTIRTRISEQLHDRDQAFFKAMIEGYIPPDLMNDTHGYTGTKTPEQAAKEQELTKSRDLTGGNEAKVTSDPEAQEEFDLNFANASGFMAALDREKSKRADQSTRKFFGKQSGRKHLIFLSLLDTLSGTEKGMVTTLWLARTGKGDAYKVAPDDQKQVLRDGALDAIRIFMINECGFPGDISTMAAAKLRSTGETGAAFDGLLKGWGKIAENNPQERINLAAEQMANFQKEDVEKLRSDQVFFKSLLKTIRDLAGQGVSDKDDLRRATDVCALAGLPPWETFVKAEKGVYAEKTNAASTITSNESQKADVAATAATQTPEFWAARLNGVLSHWNINKDRGEVATVIYETRQAAEDVEASTQATPAPKTATSFMGDVLTKVQVDPAWLKKQDEAMDVLGGGTWHDFFTGAKIPTAKFRVALSNRDIKDRSAEVSKMVQALSGPKLLHEMSNFETFKSLFAAFEAALQKPDEQGPIDAAQANLDKFVLDVNPEILTLIEKEHNNITGGRSTKSYTLVAEMRKKLATALAQDAEVRATVTEVGATLGDVDGMQARLQALLVLDLEKLSQQGVQWGLLSTKAMQRREAKTHVKGAYRELKAAQKDKTSAQITGMKTDPGNQSELTKGDARVTEMSKQTEAETKAKEKLGKNVEDYERRKDSFEAMREKYNGRLMMVINLAITAAFAIPVSILSGGVASPIVAGLIVFAFDIAKRCIAKGIEWAITGNLNVNPKQVVRTLIQLAVEAGVAAASSAVGAAAKQLWDQNIAGFDWEEAVSRAEAQGLDPNTVLKGQAEYSTPGWYATDKGLFTAPGLLAEGGKDAAVSLVKSAISSTGEKITSGLTEVQETPNWDMISGMMKGAALGGLKTATFAFLGSVSGNLTSDLLHKKQIGELEDVKGEREGAMDGKSEAALAYDKAQLDAEKANQDAQEALAKMNADAPGLRSVKADLDSRIQTSETQFTALKVENESKLSSLGAQLNKGEIDKAKFDLESSKINVSTQQAQTSLDNLRSQQADTHSRITELESRVATTDATKNDAATRLSVADTAKKAEMTKLHEGTVAKTTAISDRKDLFAALEEPKGQAEEELMEAGWGQIFDPKEGQALEGRGGKKAGAAPVPESETYKQCYTLVDLLNVVASLKVESFTTAEAKSKLPEVTKMVPRLRRRADELNELFKQVSTGKAADSVMDRYIEAQKLAQTDLKATLPTYQMMAKDLTDQAAAQGITRPVIRQSTAQKSLDTLKFLNVHKMKTKIFSGNMLSHLASAETNLTLLLPELTKQASSGAAADAITITNESDLLAKAGAAAALKVLVNGLASSKADAATVGKLETDVKVALDNAASLAVVGKGVLRDETTYRGLRGSVQEGTLTSYKSLCEDLKNLGNVDPAKVPGILSIGTALSTISSAMKWR